MSEKVILITGASSGFGKSCAEYLSLKGYKVYGTSRKPASPGASWEMIQMDVNDDTSVARGVALVIAKEGRLDVVLNNAGYGIAGSVEDTSTEDMKAQFETNYFGMFRVCREVLPVMRKQKSGYIINVGSIAGSIGVPFQGAYSACKSAVQNLTEVLRMEVKPYGIKVSLIDPGDFKTGFTDSRVKTSQSVSNPEYAERFAKALQTMEHDERKGCDPLELARLVNKIISSKSPRLRYMVGPAMEIFAVHLRKFLPSGIFEGIIMSTYKIYPSPHLLFSFCTFHSAFC
ncbi:MAG: SDR family oxidoreductase, partial [Bacteroidota bacterium]